MKLLSRLFTVAEASQGNKEKNTTPILPNPVQVYQQNLEEIFEQCSDITYTPVKLNVGKEMIEGLLIYSNVLVNLDVINKNIIHPINSYKSERLSHGPQEPSLIYDKDHTPSKGNIRSLEIFAEIITTSNIKKIDHWSQVVQSILYGNTVLFTNYCSTALVLETKGKEGRSIAESTVESAIRSPRDSFIEDIDTNIGLIRKRIKSSHLKVMNMIIGSESHTTISVLYMENKVNHHLLENIIDLITNIETEVVLESAYIEQHLEQYPYSPFPQTQITERPDKVCGDLMEGRIIILTDGSPIALVLPITFFQLFHSSEDYYTRIISSNLTRFFRFMGFFIATSLPSIYVALISFHHEMIPMNLLIDLSKNRTNVPFPPVIEALLMEVAVELIREASNRLPQSIGQTIGIVGAIVIGDAAIQSNFASPTMVIVIGITVIGSYIFPHYNTSYALRILRIPIIIMAATFGAFGIVISWCWVIIHLCNLESFGYPYLFPLAPLDNSVVKDGIIKKGLKN